MSSGTLLDLSYKARLVVGRGILRVPEGSRLLDSSAAPRATTSWIGVGVLDRERELSTIGTWEYTVRGTWLDTDRMEVIDVLLLGAVPAIAPWAAVFAIGKAGANNQASAGEACWVTEGCICTYRVSGYGPSFFFFADCSDAKGRRLMRPVKLLPALLGDVPVPGPKGSKLHLSSLFPLQLGWYKPKTLLDLVDHVLLELPSHSLLVCGSSASSMLVVLFFDGHARPLMGGTAKGRPS